jgi:hypothetical protein
VVAAWRPVLRAPRWAVRPVEAALERALREVLRADDAALARVDREPPELRAAEPELREPEPELRAAEPELRAPELREPEPELRAPELREPEPELRAPELRDDPFPELRAALRCEAFEARDEPEPLRLDAVLGELRELAAREPPAARAALLRPPPEPRPELEALAAEPLAARDPEPDLAPDDDRPDRDEEVERDEPEPPPVRPEDDFDCGICVCSSLDNAFSANGARLAHIAGRVGFCHTRVPHRTPRTPQPRPHTSSSSAFCTWRRFSA